MAPPQYESYSLFFLPSNFLSDLPATVAAEATVPLPTTTVQDVQPGNATTCSACGGLQFSNTELMRAHYKSDWHRYNVRRRVRSQPPVNESQFDELAEVSSIEASDSEDESGDERQSARAKAQAGSPFVAFRLPGEESKAALVYKQVLYGKKNSDVSEDASQVATALQRLQSKQESNACWTLLMVGAGHFAGAVFDCRTGKAVAHKTFHRYTTRRKQGGAQSSNDQAKGKAKSAGAQIRRYNEQALQQDIRNLLAEWKDYVKQSRLLFVRATGFNRASIFFDTSPVPPTSDERVRSFPFTTRRPTFSELERCFKELSTVRVQEWVAPSEPSRIDSQTTNADTSGLTKGKGAEEPTEAAPPPVDERLTKLSDFAKRGKLDLLKSNIESPPEFDLNSILPDDLGISLLHIAASNGHVDVIGYLLDSGADPCVRGGRKNLTPYEVATTKDARDEFRRFVARAPDRWDFSQSAIPGPLTAEMEAKQKDKEREKKKKQKEKQKAAAKDSPGRVETPPPEPEVLRTAPKRVGLTKLSKTEQEAVGMSAEKRAMLDREKRYRARGRRSLWN
ncbi:hypothetical protein HK097_006385 [Rhizophlyctis rosea]|uniref:VLRF1 domain-containing protein n=1 Tax=Rhizophlyctis rosea TaxID=64517 RepID=A0AAD5SKL8_9FUNG|nr:hypothetical protein HK097_006385 [Rhizophlyctis rosea]